MPLWRLAARVFRVARSPNRLFYAIAIRVKRAQRRVGLEPRPTVVVGDLRAYRFDHFLYPALAKAFILQPQQHDVRLVFELLTLREFLTRVALPDASANVGESKIHVVREDSDAQESGRAHRRFTVSTDWFSPQPSVPSLVMPYFGHPSVYTNGLHRKLSSFRAQRKGLRVGFAGSLAEREYRQQFAFDMLNRVEIVSTVRRAFRDQILLIDSSDRSNASVEKYKPLCFRITTSAADRVTKHALSTRDYLRFLARCWFFLAAPGVEMPLAHNLIEGMAVGAIPVLNYAEYVGPGLIDGVNCLRFTTRDELIEKIRWALAANEETLVRMRLRVLDYYEHELSVDAFAERLTAASAGDLTIVVNSEGESVSQFLRRARGAAPVV